MEEGLEPHSQRLLPVQLPLPHGGGVGQVEVPQPSGAAPRGVENNQRRDATQVHALQGASIPGTHQCQTQGVEPIYRVDQAGQLLPWSCSQERPTPPVPAPGRHHTPRGPQIHPSETQALMQKKVDTPTTSHPTMGGEGSMTQGAHSDPPIPMETGGAGDSRSWAEQVEAAHPPSKEEWRRDRPTKQCWSSPRR